MHIVWLQLLQFYKMVHRYHLYLNVRIAGEYERNSDKMGTIRAVESVRDRMETI